MNNLVSVIIPVFNRFHLSDRSIESVLYQSHQDWELKQLVELHKFRTRGYYHMVIKSVHKYSYGKILTLLSKFLCP